MNEMITVPLYENHIKDYRVSQTIRYGVKWTSIGSVPLTFLVMNDAHEDCEFLCAAVVLSAAVLVPVAGAGGSAFGYYHGKRLNKIKKSDPEYFTEAFSFGHEFSYCQQFVKNSDFKAEYNPQYSLTYQHFGSNKFIPSEYRLGFTVREFRENVFEDYMSDSDVKEKRLSFDVLFNSNSDVFQLYYGIGAGYSWGEHLAQIDYENTETEKICGYFLYPLAGATFNVIDLFYLRLEGYYEMSEFYKIVTDIYGSPDAFSYGLRFSFGTYLF
jgi:hypothetical protein